MSMKLKDLTVEELRGVISQTVRETLEEVLEDLSAKSSKEFLASIREARKDYQAGRVKDLDDLMHA